MGSCFWLFGMPFICLSHNSPLQEYKGVVKCLSMSLIEQTSYVYGSFTGESR